MDQSAHKLFAHQVGAVSRWPLSCVLLIVLFTACSSGPGLTPPAPAGTPASLALGERVFPGFGTPATGSGPVWEIGLPANATLHLDQLGYT